MWGPSPTLRHTRRPHFPFPPRDAILANGQEGKVIQSDQSDRRNCAAAIEMVEHGRPTEVLFFATLLLSYSISIGHSNDLMFVGCVAGSVLQTEHKFKP